MAALAPPSSALRVERLAITPELRTRWRELALASGNVYLTPEWIEPWMRHLGGDGELFLYGARRDGELVALVPLHREHRHGIGLVRFAGHEPADQPGMVCAPADLGLAREALAHALREPALRWDVFLSDRQPDDRPRPLPAPGSVRERYPDLWVEFDESGWDGYLASRSRSLRYKLRHDRRRLEELGARYESAPVDDPEPVVRELLELHDERWPAGSRFTSGRRRDFQLEMLALAAERGWLRIRRIVVGGETVVSHAAFRFGDVEHGYLVGRRMGISGVALGYAGFAFELREAVAESASAYRYGYGSNEHKTRFANRSAAVETIAWARTLRGRAALAVQAHRRSRATTAIDPSAA